MATSSSLPPTSLSVLVSAVPPAVLGPTVGFVFFLWGVRMQQQSMCFRQCTALSVRVLRDGGCLPEPSDPFLTLCSCSAGFSQGLLTSSFSRCYLPCKGVPFCCAALVAWWAACAALCRGRLGPLHICLVFFVFPPRVRAVCSCFLSLLLVFGSFRPLCLSQLRGRAALGHFSFALCSFRTRFDALGSCWGGGKGVVPATAFVSLLCGCLARLLFSCALVFGLHVLLTPRQEGLGCVWPGWQLCQCPCFEALVFLRGTPLLFALSGRALTLLVPVGGRCRGLASVGASAS